MTHTMISRLVSATVWQIDGARLHYPRSTRARIRWDPDTLGSSAAVVELDADSRRVCLPYEPLRFAAEREVLWWHGNVLAHAVDEARVAGEWCAARVVVARSLLRRPDGRAEEVNKYLSVEILDEHCATRLALADLQQALWLSPLRRHAPKRARPVCVA